MYRWQSPAPPAVVAYRTRRALRNLAHEGRAFHEQDLAPAQPSVPSMTVDGVEYVEEASREVGYCVGCTFYRNDPGGCSQAEVISVEAFGGDCHSRNVIYIRKA